MAVRHHSKRKIVLGVLSKLLALAGLVVLLTGIAISARQHVVAKLADIRFAYEVSLANIGLPSSAPSTVRPEDSEFANYTVPADEPRYLFIPKLSVRAMVKPMGLTGDNKIQAPANVHHVGWFTQSARPGQKGVTVLDGHVSNWGARSVFHDLKTLKPGDRIDLERGDGQTIVYAVVKSQSYDAHNVDMAAALTPVNPEKSGLNLITCDGKVLPGNQYEKRLIVFAEQI